ncbi:MAG: rod-binding protein [Rickettsiales bacterium]|nr:rod-binding protein [Rickettsiales bacterium]
MDTLSIPASPLRSPDAAELKTRLKLEDQGQRAASLSNNVNHAQLEKTAQEFEATFLSQMMEHMFEGVKTNPLTGGGEAEDIYQSMMIDEYGKLIARAGGVGIANHVIQQYEKQQPKPTEPTE